MLQFPTFHKPWWRRIDLRAALCAAVGVIAVCSSVIWLYRDATDLFTPSAPAEGSLIVNINTATIEQLESLPEIGPARAHLIFVHRPYASVEDLRRVKGIPSAVLDDIKPLIRTEGDTRKR